MACGGVGLRRKAVNQRPASDKEMPAHGARGAAGPVLGASTGQRCRMARRKSFQLFCVASSSKSTYQWSATPPRHATAMCAVATSSLMTFCSIARRVTRRMNASDLRASLPSNMTSCADIDEAGRANSGRQRYGFSDVGIKRPVHSLSN